MEQDLYDSFLHPDRSYGPVPFWFLNDTLTRSEIRRQLEDFSRHGVPGVVVHPRMGFDTDVPYLSPLFFSWMTFICETARDLGMFIYLYDEGMYPSGSACGQVVRENPAYAAMGLAMLPEPESGCSVAACLAIPCENGTLFYSRAREVHSPSDIREGEVLRYFCVVRSRGTIRGLRPEEDDGQPLAPAAADLLNPEAVACFIRLTHEKYYQALSPFFGTTVRAMFTDEPSPLGRNPRHGLVPWTEGFEQEWLQAGMRPEDLPYLFPEGAEGTQEKPDEAEKEKIGKVRRTHDLLVLSRMERTYYRLLRDWCDAHGILLTGHPARPDTMHPERIFSMPGQDLVWGWVAPGQTATHGPESTLAQCAADTSLALGIPQSLCECFGCCGPAESQWGMTLGDMKWLTDWMAVRGISRLVPHAFFYSLRKPEARADRPPDVGPNNTFWRYYLDFAEYIARLSFLNTGRFSLAGTGILTDGSSLDDEAAALMYENQVPFHFVYIEDLLTGRMENGKLLLPGMHLSHLLVPASLSLSTRHLDALERFKAMGGNVVHLQNGCPDPETFPKPLSFTHNRHVRTSWQKRDGADIVMVFYERPQEPVAEPLECSLPRKRSVEIWDPWSGERSIKGVQDTFSLYIRPGQLLVLTLSDTPSALSETGSESDSDADSDADAGFIQVSNRHMENQLEQIAPGTYRLKVHADEGTMRAELLLTGVHTYATLFLDGEEVGHCLTEPYVFDLTHVIHPGENDLIILTAPCPVTKMDGIPWKTGIDGAVIFTFWKKNPDRK